jgi:hypothetical protein
MDSQNARQLALHWEQVFPSSAFTEVGRRSAAANVSKMLSFVTGIFAQIFMLCPSSTLSVPKTNARPRVSQVAGSVTRCTTRRYRRKEISAT